MFKMCQPAARVTFMPELGKQCRELLSSRGNDHQRCLVPFSARHATSSSDYRSFRSEGLDIHALLAVEHCGSFLLKRTSRR